MSHIVYFSCGHKGLISGYGSADDMKSKIEWLEENGQCAACREGRILEFEERSIEWAFGRPFLALKGTEKQVIYGSNIRHDFAYDLSLYIGEYLPDLTREDKLNIYSSLSKGDTAKAKFWINNRKMFDRYTPEAGLYLDKASGNRKGLAWYCSITA